MIRQRDGRYRSYMTPDESYEAFKRDLKILQDDEERYVAELLFAELMAASPDLPKCPWVEFAMNLEYKHPPVDIRTFVMDDYYLGKTCRETIYPELLASLEELFAGGYRVGLFTGSIGSGKTFSSSIAICYILYLISCLRSPHLTFGIAPDSDISIIALSVTTALATEVAFENIVIKVASSEYFETKFRVKVLKTELRFPSSVTVRPLASDSTSMLGKNVIAVLLDEGNFLNKNRAHQGKKDPQTGEIKDRAQILYHLLLNRISSRFEDQGRNPGMFIIASSKQTESDFTTKLIKESRRDPTVFVRDFAKWDLAPEKYSPDRFWVMVGEGAQGTKIVEAADVEEVRKNLPDGAVLFSVPENLRGRFEQDMEGSTRDLAGIATETMSPYFKRKDKLKEAFHPKREHPFTTLMLDQSKPGKFRWDLLIKAQVDSNMPPALARRNTKMLAKYFSSAARHVHIDLSLNNDFTGFCCGCIAGWRDVIRYTPGGDAYSERAPVYYIDIILGIVPPLGGEIDLREVRDLVYDLRGHGVPIVKVSLDRFQPYEGMQAFRSQGFEAELLPLSKSTAVYDVLKEAIYENRVIIHPYAPLQKELGELELDVRLRKVDHPVKKKSDLSDALAGCIYTLSKLRESSGMGILRTGMAAPSVGNADPYLASRLVDVNPFQSVPQLAAPGRLVANSSNDILFPFVG